MPSWKASPAFVSVLLTQDTSDDGRKRTGRVWDGSTVLPQRLQAHFLCGLTHDVVELESEHIEGGLIGELHAGLRIEGGDADMEALNERTETLFVGAEKFFGCLAFGDVADHNQGAAPAVEIEGRRTFARCGAGRTWCDSGTRSHEVRQFPQTSRPSRCAGGVFPETDFAGRFVQGFLAGVAGKAGKTIVDVKEGAVGKDVDSEGVGTGTKSGSEHALRAAQSFLGVEQVVGDAALPAVGEHEAGGGTDDRGGDGDPSEGQLFTSDGTAHENDEERDGNRENLSGDKLADGREGGDGSGLGLLPGDGEQDNDEVGQHPEKVTPTGSTGGGTEGKEVIGIGENSGKEDETKDRGERAKPGGQGSPGAPEEGEGENEVPDNVENEDLPEECGLLGLPAGGGVEEIEIGGGGNDSDLEEVEDAEPIDAGGVLVGARKEHHEDGSGPDEEQEIGGLGTCAAPGTKLW